MLGISTVRQPVVPALPRLPAAWWPRRYWRQLGIAAASPQDEPKPTIAAVVPVVVRVPEACALLRVSKWTLYELIRTGQLETIKIGSRRVVPVAAIQGFVERRRGQESA
jgi:excisionase family DNA binding protein